MRMSRYFIGLALAVLSCFSGAYAFAEERPVSYMVRAFDGIGEMPAASMARMELTLASWRTGSQSTDEPVASNLIALSNHFGLTSAVPIGVPDWDSSKAA